MVKAILIVGSASPKTRRLADLKVNELQADFAKFCALRVLIQYYTLRPKGVE